MASMTVFGTGSMGRAIGAIAIRGGAAVQMLGTTLEKAAEAAASIGATPGVSGDDVTGDVVVLAVQHPQLEGIASAYAAELDGRIVVDISNPTDFSTLDSLDVAADSSAAAELQAALPGASVVKAFNTNFVASLVEGSVGGVATVVQMAGDDDEAKTYLAGILTAAGLRSVDAGDLRRARELEAFGFLQMVLAARGQIAWSGGFAVIP